MTETINSDILVFFVNGKKVLESSPRPEMTLLTYLRKKLGLCGTKLGCAEGGCGACTVMVSYYVPDKEDKGKGSIQHISVNACLAPVVSVHGMAVTTVEGIGSSRTGRVHAVQERMAAAHGSQCGFCTPGIVMSMYTLLRNNPKPSMADIQTYFQGNLCRCTGYRPILEGFKSFTSPESGCTGPVNGVCCQNGIENLDEDEPERLFDANSFKPYDPSQEPIFPPELQLNHKKFSRNSVCFESDLMKWFRPTSLEELLALKSDFPNAKIVVGNTELGVEMKFKSCQYPVMIQPTQVKELNQISVQEKGLQIGSAVTLSRIEQACMKEIQSRPKFETRVLQEIIEMLKWFAGKQIRNVAALGGNIMTGSPISDLNPILMAAKCTLIVQRQGQQPRAILMDSGFYTSYRKNILAADEVLVSILLPFTRKSEYFIAYKQARRRDDDIAIVNSAFFFEMNQDSKEIVQCRIAFGGMAPTTTMPAKTMDFLTGRQWNKETIERACEFLLEDLPLPPGVPGAMVRYRQTLTMSFLFKAFLAISEQSGLQDIPEDWKSSLTTFHKDDVEGHQFFEIQRKPELTPVGQPIKHKSGLKQATGEAVYVDDMPSFENELYAGLVLSKKAHAEIIKLDATEALKVDGVIDFVCAKDISDERNNYQITIKKDEFVFAKDKVTAIGQVIGLVLASDQATAQRAAKMVQVIYKELPTIITIEEAIAANSFHEWDGNSIKCGHPLTAILQCDHTVEGEMRTGAQEHFYLESQACIVVPTGEDGEMKMYVSTQNPTETQEVVANVLGVDMNKIVCHVKRMGGGFGGKETRSIPVTAPCAVAAAKWQKPVRIMLDRDEDMMLSGHRHPFLGRYKAGFNKDGKIIALDVDLYNNAGCTVDLSCPVMERGLFHIDNSYKIDHLHVRGHVCKTNLPSNTAFRGFGGPQGMMVTEAIIDHIASFLGMDAAVVRAKNLYKEGQLTHFNQCLENCTLERCWQECLRKSNYEEAKRQVETFNQSNRWKKRGISIVPVKFGIAFTFKTMNQSGALVQVYRDGSVLLSHGGTEMGQGVHTKMIQVASQAFGIPHEKIHISETATDKVPNTSPSAASATSDLNGMAILNACREILKRLEPLKSKGQTWEELIHKAYFERISLSAAGFHATPGIGYDFKTNSGNPFNYFTYGVGCSVVEIDCLTGDHNVLRTDIVMDLGESLNPAIDIGQVEGGFVQGYGLFLMEQLIHTPEGDLLTKGPGAYKIPGFGDIPSQFNVSLLRGAPNPRAVFSSKAVGEPPLFLASSIFFAVKEAIRAARKSSGLDPNDFRLDSPATAERIRMACDDQFTKRVPQLPKPGSFRPWGIQA